MLFNSIDFIIFLPIVVLIYFVIPYKLKKLWLLVASYFFYMCWNAKYITLILISTVITFLGGSILEKIKHYDIDELSKTLRKRIILAICLVLNIGILFVFKYINFASYIISKFMSLIHVNFVTPTFDILLPVGISFYTFQAVGYMIDVYRNEIKAEKNFINYALFVSFFPQLVAGPIERSKNLLFQVSNPRKFNYDDFREGIWLMIWGFFLKIAIADRIGVFVNNILQDVYQYTGWYIVVTAFFISLQIYCDFYGYSTIAKGTAKILGINLMENFNAPFLSRTIKEVWRNWHISLTSWFTDYLYIPLGGNRKGKLRKYINIIIVFAVSGLWHGASFNYILWGLINGFYQIISEIIAPLRNIIDKALRINRETFFYSTMQRIVSFILFSIAFIPFRVANISETWWCFKEFFNMRNFNVLLDGSLFSCGVSKRSFIILLMCIAVLTFSDILKVKGIEIRKIIMKQNFVLRWIMVVACVLFILIYGMWGPSYDIQRFIYFQF